MAGFQLYVRRWLGTFSCGFILVICTPAVRAQDEDAVEVPAANEAANSLTPEQFRQWVDQTVMGAVDAGADAHGEAETILELKIEHLARTCAISEPQQKKLRLAGHGDIKRFFDKVAEAKDRFAQAKGDEQRMSNLQSEVQTLAGLRGKQMFADGSLYAKMASKILSAEQAAQLEVAARESRLFRHQAKIDLAVQNLDIAVGLTDRERRQLVELLRRQTRPARKATADFDTELVYVQTADLPERMVRRILRPDQWQAWSKLLPQLRLNQQPGVQDVVLEPKAEPTTHASPAAEVLPRNVFTGESPRE